MAGGLQWYEELQRSDCRQCKHRKDCGDIFPEEGKCPANTGGETWAKYEAGECTLKVHLIRHDGTEETLEPAKKPVLEQMQKWVDGYIEPLQVRHAGVIRTMVVNEEGLLWNLPFNVKASSIAHRMIVGDVFILEGWKL